MAVSRPVTASLPIVSLADLGSGALPAGTELVAGEVGLPREVVWCAVLRARAPALQPLRGGELLLVDPAVLRLVDSRLTLTRLIESVSALNVAGLAVSGTVPPESRREAAERNLPVYRLPDGTDLEALEQQLLRYIVDRRAELHERTQDLHRQLSELAMAGRGLRAVLNRLTELVGLPVLFEERGGNLEYVSAGKARTLPVETGAAVAADRAELEAWLKDVPLSAFDPPVTDRPLPGQQTRLVAPILVNGSIGGFVSLVGEVGQLGEFHRLAVGRASHACAIELVRAGAAKEARDEAEEELLSALIAGRAGAAERARRRGVDLQAGYLVLAAAAERVAADRLRSTWDRRLSGLHIPFLLSSADANLLLLIGQRGKRAPDWRRLIADLHQSGRSSTQGPVAIGYAAARAGTANVGGAGREAEQALLLGRRLFGPDAVTAFADLGLYRLLYALEAAPALRAFYRDSLKPLADNDRGGVLIQTLRAFLASNGSPTEAAQHLHLHRNTVLYRLGRIEDLLGVSLKDADQRLTLHLALKVADMLELEPATPPRGEAAPKESQIKTGT
jgi:purine catabolism regulator